MRFGIAETEEERQAVYRLRYDVYVEEMGRYHGVADHERRMLYEDCDAHSRISYAADGDSIVATARLTWGGDAPIPQRMIDQYGLAPFLAEIPADAIAVGERAMVRPHLRGTDLLFKMMTNGIGWANERRIQLLFGDCEPHLLNLYLGLGQRTYSKRNVNSAEAGYLVPIVTVLEDIAYFRQIKSPFIPFLTDFGADARVPDIIRRVFAEGTAVMSRTHMTPSAYWSEVSSALGEVGQISALDGFSEEEAARCLEKSSIIECQAGDRILKKGGVARNLFVVLEGTLEVRGDDDAVLAVISKGDVFGEMAFLLERPRTRDVHAATDETRILSMSEANLRSLIASDPAIAAHLMLNISKMLCLRLLRER